MDDPEYARLRGAFVDLCCSFAPVIKWPERRLNAGTEFDQLVLSGTFVRIAVSEGHLLAKTRIVRARLETTMRILGEYLIDISRGTFLAFNLTRQVSGHNGPHINAEGVFCMPSGKQEITDLIANGRLAEALEAIEVALWIHGQGIPFVNAALEFWPIELEENPT